MTIDYQLPTMILLLDRMPIHNRCIRRVKLYNPTSMYHLQRSSNLFAVIAIFIIFCICICQAGCPKCSAKYLDQRLRTGERKNHDPRVSLEQEEVKAFKRSFLNKLGLRRPPSRDEVARANVSIEILENMKRVYQLSILETNRSHELYPELETKQFFSFTGTGAETATTTSPGNKTSSSSSTESVQLNFGNFSLPRKRRDHIRVHSAKLQLYFNNVYLSNEVLEDRGRAEIYQTVQERNRRSGVVNEIRQLLDVRPVSFNSPGWVTFDIKEAVRRWEQDTNTAINSGLEIQLSRPELREALVIDSQNHIEKSTEHNEINRGRRHQKEEPQGSWHPRLDVTIKEKPRRRSRRSLRSRSSRFGTDCRAGESTCCRYQRTVSFADLDWDYWIHSPAEYNAYYCDGSCPQTARMASTYATIKAQMHLVDPTQWNAPCCTASRLGPLPILHYDIESPDRFSVSVMDDWVVEECMCM